MEEKKTNTESKEIALADVKQETLDEAASVPPENAKSEQKIAQLEQENKTLTAEIALLTEQLTVEKQNRMAEKQDADLRLALVKAGAEDPDYLVFKLHEDPSFDQNAALLEQDQWIDEAKKQFPGFFKKPAQAANIQGIKPGESGPSRATTPDAGLLTYSQAKRLQERNTGRR
ncbi:MAG: hypothetical protein RR977_03830 [Oscillospiraceae bacterium]